MNRMNMERATRPLYLHRMGVSHIDRIMLLLLLCAVLLLARGQDECPPIQESDLGNTTTPGTSGLIAEALGEPSQVVRTNIVCLGAGPTRGRYRYASVVASYTCTGGSCTGGIVNSQFDFECVDFGSGPEWYPAGTLGGENVFTPPDATILTSLRTDCSFCVDPARADALGLTVDMVTHCADCHSSCTTPRCTGVEATECCNYYESDTCIVMCTSPLIPDANNDCVMDCGSLSDPTNGQVNFITTTEGSVATYACTSTGYYLFGNSTRTCQADGQWSGNMPSCNPVDCGSLTNPSHGVVTVTATTFGSTANYSCNAFFGLDGTTSRTCQADGMWTGNEPMCTIIDCGGLSSPTNGQLTLSTTTFGSIANYTCDTGYNLVGNMIRTCQMNREWSGSGPICEAIDCEGLTAPVNGQVSYPSGTLFGSIATYSCNTGYNLDVGTPTRTCQSNGMWSGSAPSCQGLDCGSGDLNNPVNGQVSFSMTTLNSDATYECNPGYILQGGQTRTCQIDGTWSGTEPTCQILHCDPLPSPSNGQVTFSSGAIPFGSTASFECDTGYSLTGSSVRTCEASGTWSGSETNCEAVDCDPLSAPVNGQVSFPSGTTLGSIATYSCNIGHNVQGGTPMRTCNSNGDWSGSAPTCERVNCGTLSDITNGMVSYSSGTSYNSIALYSCNTGYEVQGTSTRRCQADRTWDGSKPNCQIVDCGALTDPMNGKVDFTTTTYGSSATYSCNTGYTLVGGSVRACQDSGGWSGSAPTCDCFLMNCVVCSGDPPECLQCFSPYILNIGECSFHQLSSLATGGSLGTRLPECEKDVQATPCLVSFCSRCDSDNPNNCLDCETGYELNSLESACVLDDNGNGGDGGSVQEGSDGSNTLEIVVLVICSIVGVVVLLAIIAGIITTLYRRKNTPRPHAPRHTTEEPVTYHKHPPGRIINPIYTNSNAPPQAENEYQTKFGPVEEGLDTESFCSSVLDGSQTFLTKIDEESDSSNQLELI